MASTSETGHNKNVANFSTAYLNIQTKSRVKVKLYYCTYLSC